MAHLKEVTESYKYGRLIPKLKFVVRHRPLKMSQPEGQLGRLKMMRQTVTALFKHERIELNFARASEARGYAERLISDAMRYGDCHRPTMEMADFWLQEKQLIHKLFKVLAPRYNMYETTYTRLFKAPIVASDGEKKKAILELRGNPYPPVITVRLPNYFQIHNILLHEAKKEFQSERSSSDDETDAFEHNSMQSHPVVADDVAQLTQQLNNLTSKDNHDSK